MSQESIKKLVEEAWGPLGQTIHPEGETCPRIRNCELYKEKESDGLYGFIALYCERFPGACDENPFKVNKEFTNLK